MKRRGFLGLVAGVSVFSVIARYFSVEKEVNIDSRFPGFMAFLDTLIPADETPGATDANVHLEIYYHAQKIPNYIKLLELGCQWLNMNARNFGADNYTSLSQTDRGLIVEKAERGNVTSIEKIFFDRIYLDAFRFYYANPASWSSLGLFSPPQPLGYPDYDKPPLQS